MGGSPGGAESQGPTYHWYVLLSILFDLVCLVGLLLWGVEVMTKYLLHPLKIERESRFWSS